MLPSLSEHGVGKLTESFRPRKNPNSVVIAATPCMDTWRRYDFLWPLRIPAIPRTIATLHPVNSLPCRLFKPVVRRTGVLAESMLVDTRPGVIEGNIGGFMSAKKLTDMSAREIPDFILSESV